MDWILIAAVTCQATIFAYVHHPIWKAFILSLPIPFTLAMLALGHPLDITNLAGFGLLLIFYQVVRFAYRNWRWPIVAAILLALVLHVFLAYSLAACLPRGTAFFWLTAALIIGAACAQFALDNGTAEEGYRTPLPVWLKLPAIALVTFCVVVMKGSMQGFITAFPMVGLIAAYEGRFVLGTICRQMPLLVMMMFPMMLTIAIVQPRLGYAWALVPGWLVFLCILVPVMLKQSQKYAVEKA